MRSVCFIAKFIYENSYRLCVLHVQLQFKIYIFNNNGKEEQFYHYNSHLP